MHVGLGSCMNIWQVTHFADKGERGRVSERLLCCFTPVSGVFTWRGNTQTLLVSSLRGHSCAHGAPVKLRRCRGQALQGYGMGGPDRLVWLSRPETPWGMCLCMHGQDPVSWSNCMMQMANGSPAHIPDERKAQDSHRCDRGHKKWSPCHSPPMIQSSIGRP